MKTSIDRKQVMEEHKKMWNWIAEQYARNRNSGIRVLKKEYIKQHTNVEHISCDCFLCDYAFNVMMIEQLGTFKNSVERCKYCPVIWVGDKEDEHMIRLRCCPCENEDSLYNRMKCAITLETKSRLAKEIANLSEKEK